jgi:hypothetical protein
MSNAIASRIASLAAALAVTASLVFGVTGMAHASARTAATVVAASGLSSTQA